MYTWSLDVNYIAVLGPHFTGGHLEFYSGK